VRPAGTVTIPLEDYHKLLEVQEKTETLNSNTKRASKEIAVFLSFLTSRTDVAPYVEEFNKQSTSAKIIVEDGRARIQLTHDKD
tara:strand:+ start:118 stop:369 length:252 start_codon:yes stop_codon:yes gene_type:complete